MPLPQVLNKSIRLFVLFVGLLLQGLPISAQKPVPKEKIALIDSLIAQVPLLMRSNEKNARKHMKQIEQLSAAYHYQHGLVETAFFKAWITYRHGSADQCIRSIDSAIKYIPNLSRDPAEVKFYILKGQCYVKKTQFDQAVQNFSIALRIAKLKKDDASRTGAMISIGWAYMEDSKPKEAIGFFLEVLNLNPHRTYNNRATVLCNIASCYNMMDNYQTAAKYARLGIEAAKASNSMVDLANGLNILARSDYQQGKFKDAIRNLTEASKAREKVEDPAMLASDYLELADVYRKIKQPQQAILYAKKAEAISYVNKIDLKLASSYQALAHGFEDIGDFRNASRYYQKLISHRDSTGTGSYSKALAELQVKFATEKRISENLKLKKENLESRLSNSNKQKWLIILIAGLVVLSGSGLYVFYVIRIKYRARLALEQLKEQKNRTLAIMETEESERRRIAGDLHDGVCQMLVAAAMQLKNADGNSEVLAKVDYLLDQATAEVRSVSHQMTPELLLHYGLLHAIEQGVARLNEMKSRTIFTLFDHVEIEEINEMLAVVLYRAFQELTSNIIKHAAATQVSVHLIVNEEEVVLMIEDDGKGFDITQLQYGLGLKNLERRIKLLDGNLTLDSTLNRGTTAILKFNMPVAQKN